jgi:steroid delta-isomerase-like uncharacterized protein
MVTQDNATLARRLQEEVFAQGAADVAEAILAPDFQWHAPNLPPDVSPDREGIKRYAAMLHTAYPDVRFTYEQTIAEGDKVVTYWTARATQQGPLMTIPATGRPIMVTGIDIFRIVDGRIAELWESWDQLGMLQQLGAIPQMAAAPA